MANINIDFRNEAEAPKMEQALKSRTEAKIYDFNKEKSDRTKREIQAEKVVQKEVQRAMEGVTGFFTRQASLLHFKDQTKRIDAAAARIAKHQDWFNARQEEIHETLQPKVAEAMALDEAKLEMAKQITKLREDFERSREVVATMRANLKWYQGLKKMKARAQEAVIKEGEREVEESESILKSHTEKQSQRYENLQSARSKFAEILNMDDAYLTRLIEGQIKKEGSEDTLTIQQLITQQPKEIRSILKSVVKQLLSQEGRKFNRIQAANLLIKGRKSREQLHKQMEAIKIGDTITIQTADGAIQYRALKMFGGSVEMVPTENFLKAPVLYYDMKKREIKVGGFMRQAEKAGAVVRKGVKTVKDFMKGVSATATATNDNIQASISDQGQTVDMKQGENGVWERAA